MLRPGGTQRRPGRIYGMHNVLQNDHITFSNSKVLQRLFIVNEWATCVQRKQRNQKQKKKFCSALHMKCVIWAKIAVSVGRCNAPPQNGNETMRLLTLEETNHLAGRKAAFDFTKSLEIFQFQVLGHVQHERVVGQSCDGDFHGEFCGKRSYFVGDFT